MFPRGPPPGVNEIVKIARHYPPSPSSAETVVRNRPTGGGAIGRNRSTESSYGRRRDDPPAVVARARRRGSGGFGCLDGEDLVEAAPMARLAAEFRGEECGRALEREFRTDDPRAQHQDVHVVVLDALVRRVRVVADRRADAADLARGNRRAHARAADQDAAIRDAAADRFTKALREVGVIVVRVGPVATQIDELVVRAAGPNPADQLVLEGGAGMVRGEANAHASLRSVVAGIGPGRTIDAAVARTKRRVVARLASRAPHR